MWTSGNRGLGTVDSAIDQIGVDVSEVGLLAGDQWRPLPVVVVFFLHRQLRICCVTDLAILLKEIKEISTKKTGKILCLGGKK